MLIPLFCNIGTVYTWHTFSYTGHEPVNVSRVPVYQRTLACMAADVWLWCVVFAAHRCGADQSSLGHLFRAQLLPQRRNLLHNAVSWPSILRVSLLMTNSQSSFCVYFAHWNVNKYSTALRVLFLATTVAPGLQKPHCDSYCLQITVYLFRDLSQST